MGGVLLKDRAESKGDLLVTDHLEVELLVRELLENGSSSKNDNFSLVSSE